MNKSLLVTALILASGLLLAKPSHAQFPAQYAGGSVQDANGYYWNVLATQQGVGSNVWNVFVNFANGQSKPGADYLTALDFSFTEGGTLSGTTLTGYSGITVSSPSGQLANGYQWLSGVTNFGYTAEYADPPPGGSPNPAGDLNSGNGFVGALTLTPTAGQAPTALTVELDSNNCCVCTDSFAVLPEGQSIALLLPGLIPIGLILRRRRRT